MERERYIEEVARQLEEVANIERQAKADRAVLRGEFLRLADYDFKGREHLLPVNTIEVPEEFFNKTGLTKEEFVKSRFPGWNVEHCEYNTITKRTVFVLKRSPEYIGRVVEIDDGNEILQVAKEVAEFEPEIDWSTLQDERPDLFEKLAVPVTSYELDEGYLETMMHESPEELATLQRHMKVRAPQLRVTPRRVKKDGKRKS